MFEDNRSLSAIARHLISVLIVKLASKADQSQKKLISPKAIANESLNKMLGGMFKLKLGA